MWATHGIFSYTVEMYPPSSGTGGGFYPPDEQIVPQTTRLRETVLLFGDHADCVYRIIGKRGPGLRRWWHDDSLLGRL